MKKVFICSPYSGDITNNTIIAQQLMFKALEIGVAPFLPHLLYTQVLDDCDQQQRQQGVLAGLSFMNDCDEVWVYTNGAKITKGVRVEVEHAKRLSKTIIYLSDNFLS